jgi:hypothetical protein
MAIQPALLFLVSSPLLSLPPAIHARRHKNHQHEGTNGLHVSAGRGRVRTHQVEVWPSLWSCVQYVPPEKAISLHPPWNSGLIPAGILHRESPQ